MQMIAQAIFYNTIMLQVSADTLDSIYNEKKYAEILLHYRRVFIKDDVLIGEWCIFCAEVFLHYSQFFIKGDFIIGRVECMSAPPLANMRFTTANDIYILDITFNSKMCKHSLG